MSVDGKSLGLRRKVERLASCLPRVFVGPEQREVFWGGFSLLQATLDCARALQSHDWRYWINLAAQDFPLHPQRQIKLRLSRMLPKSLVQILPEPKR